MMQNKNDFFGTFATKSLLKLQVTQNYVKYYNQLHRVENNVLRKRKIVNDPVYGFINITGDLVFDLIEHRYFQRLRRIKQLGLTDTVYPGAHHTRFHHAVGAMHLMCEAIQTLRSKGHEITEQEEQGAIIAILLHDIGHGPFSHALENSILHGISHEDVSEILMNKLNQQFGGALDLAINIFRNTYSKKFLHQLVSSQLDVDRLDYLKRDSFFTGVSEGVINADRIIKMMNISDDELVVEAKAIYSIEKFIVARRLMYWQVYLHKTVLAAEKLIIKILQRAKYLASRQVELFCTPQLHRFLYNDYGKQDLILNEDVLEDFAGLDDVDIFASIKVWCRHDDKILATLCDNMVNRKLFRVELSNNPFDLDYIQNIKRKTVEFMGITEEETSYFVFDDSIENNAYTPYHDRITILQKDGQKMDITDAFDQLNVAVLAKTVKKYVLCYPKNVGERF